MEILLTEEVVLSSKFNMLLFISFVLNFVMYIAIRVTQKHSAKAALKAPLVLFTLMVGLGYYEYSSRWFLIKINNETIELSSAKNNASYIVISDVLTIRPRFGRSACSIVIRTKDDVYTSAEVKTEKCREASRKLNAVLIDRKA